MHVRRRRNDITALEMNRHGARLADDTISPRKVVRWLLWTVLILGITTFVLRTSFVMLEKVASVDQLRSVADAELRQDCCVIFYSPKGATSQTTEQLKNTRDCMQILQKEKEKHKTNRCETAKMVLKNSWWHQFIMEVWIEVIPFADMSISDILVRFVMSSSGMSMLGYAMRAVMGDDARPVNVEQQPMYDNTDKEL